MFPLFFVRGGICIRFTNSRQGYVFRQMIDRVQHFLTDAVSVARSTSSRLTAVSSRAWWGTGWRRPGPASSSGLRSRSYALLAGIVRRFVPRARQAAPAHPTSAARPRAVIIAWDMTHNAIGRAYLLADMLARDYDVLVIGPMFARYGSTVWAPVQSSKIEHRAFLVQSTGDFARSALDVVENHQADVVIACKPRMPAIFLALLLKHRLGCPVLLDVDDHELSFFSGAEPIPLQGARRALDAETAAIEQPYGEVWTKISESLISTFDGVTVSNIALKNRFGGTLIRHARDEDLFGPDKRSRAHIRAEFGYSEKDRVVLFLGTPRAHKGIFRIADAFRRLKRKELVLCIIGDVTAKSVTRQLAEYQDVRINLFSDQPWSRLPELMRLADGVCLLQDEGNPVAQYQIPAKLTDALATGVPVAVTDVPPFSDIPAGTVTVIRSEEDLDSFLGDVASGSTADAFVEQGRKYFLSEMSYAANRTRLLGLISESLSKPPIWRKEWPDFLTLVAEYSGANVPTERPDWAA